MKIPIGISARHVHLTREDADLLFGDGYQFTILKDLSQAEEYAYNETLTIKTSKGEIKNVRVLGPERDYTQVEISKTDAYSLGINPPIRESGDILGSESITLVSDKAELYKPYGCIISMRHIHLNSREALDHGIDKNKKYKVILGGEKGGIIENVSAKIKDSYHLELHIDLDDANAHLVKSEDEGELIINEE